MKLEWKSSTTAVDGVSMPCHYLNTPTGVVLEGGGDHVKIDGCNLTDEGEFIRAPGFGDLAVEMTMAGRRKDAEISALRKGFETMERRIRDYCKATLNFPVTQPGQQFCASEILKILDGDVG